MSRAVKKTRPATPLSRPLILRAALGIVDAEGLEGLTVRRLAKELDVTAMAIYRHYDSKDAIERSLVDLVVGDYDVTNHDEPDWRDWICTTCERMRRGLCEHPAIIPLLSKATYAGSDAMAVLERVLRTLCEAGLAPAAATQLFHTLMAYTIGSVTLMDQESLRPGRTRRRRSAEERRRREFERASSASHPIVVKTAPHLAGHFEGRHFEAGLRAIVAGVLATDNAGEFRRVPDLRVENWIRARA